MESEVFIYDHSIYETLQGWCNGIVKTLYSKSKVFWQHVINLKNNLFYHAIESLDGDGYKDGLVYFTEGALAGIDELFSGISDDFQATVLELENHIDYIIISTVPEAFQSYMIKQVNAVVEKTSILDSIGMIQNITTDLKDNITTVLYNLSGIEKHYINSDEQYYVESGFLSTINAADLILIDSSEEINPPPDDSWVYLVNHDDNDLHYYFHPDDSQYYYFIDNKLEVEEMLVLVGEIEGITNG